MAKNKDRWSALSMKERADLINTYVSNGIKDLKEIKRHYNSFGDGGDTKTTTDPDKQWLQEWVTNRPEQFKENVATYANQSDRGSIASRNEAKISKILSLISGSYERKKLDSLIQNQINELINTDIVDLSTGEGVNENTQLVQRFKDRQIYGTSVVVGEYFPQHQAVVLNSNYPSGTKEHELTHAMTYQYPYQQAKIDKIFKKYGEDSVNPKNGKLYTSPYYDNAREIYPRLMEFRKLNNLNPKHIVTKEDLEAWRNSTEVKDRNILNRYSDDILLELFNKVAINTTNENSLNYTNPENIAAYGGRINKFGPGGDLNNGGLTLEEYLQAKADSTRMAAFNASELATKGIEIKYPLSEKDRWNNDRVIHNYLYENTSMYSPPRNDEVEEFNSRDEYQYKDLEAEYQQASRENRENCDFGSNCIGTTTSFYPKDSREIQNTEFLKNYEQRGFYPVEEPEKGDIAIAVSASTGHPYHGMIYAGKDVYGNVFNYSRGGITEEDYKKHAYFPGNHLYFRYKGTPELIQQWTEEYLSNQKAEGGRISGDEEDTLYYDDTYIEPAVVKAFSSAKEYNRWKGEQGAKVVRKGTNNAAQSIYNGLFLTPVLGDALDATNAAIEAKEGNWKNAAMLAGLTFLPNFIEKPLKALKKSSKKAKAIKKVLDPSIVPDYINTIDDVTLDPFSIAEVPERAFIPKEKEVIQLSPTRATREKEKFVEDAVAGAYFARKHVPKKPKLKEFKIDEFGFLDDMPTAGVGSESVVYLGDDIAYKRPRHILEHRITRSPNYSGGIAEVTPLPEFRDVQSIVNDSETYLKDVNKYWFQEPTSLEGYFKWPGTSDRYLPVYSQPKGIKSIDIAPTAEELRQYKYLTEKIPHSNILLENDLPIPYDTHTGNFMVFPDGILRAIDVHSHGGRLNIYEGGGPIKYFTNSTASPTQFFDDYLANYTKLLSMSDAPIDEKELVRRQAWAESAGNDKAGSRKGAKGRYQIMPDTLAEYQKATKDIGNIYDPVYNRRVRDWEFNRYKDSDQVNRGEPTDSVKMGRRLAIYNYGYGNTRKALNAAVKAGIDINTSFDWLQKFPKETRDYVNFILRNKDTGAHRTNDAYKNRKK